MEKHQLMQFLYYILFQTEVLWEIYWKYQTYLNSLPFRNVSILTNALLYPREIMKIVSQNKTISHKHNSSLLSIETELLKTAQSV